MTQKKKTPNKKYSVDIWEQGSTTVIVSAKTESEAKRKAWKSFKPKKKDYNIEADCIEWN